MKRKISSTKIPAQKASEQEQGENISIKEVFKTLSLFFVLTLISIVMFFSKFEQGVEDFWAGKQENSQVKEAIEQVITMMEL